MTVRIVVFAKVPQPGFAKTRLIPALGEAGAAELAQRMLHHALTTAQAAGVGPVELCITPDAFQWGQTRLITKEIVSAPESSKSIESDPIENIEVTGQGEGDLGARMARAAQRVIGAGEALVLIGTDCPELTAGHLKRVADALQHFDAVLIPATDGGYVLLGLRRFHPAIFADIAWSTDTVAAATLARLRELFYSVRQFSVLRDIDNPDDLKWLPGCLPD